MKKLIVCLLVVLGTFNNKSFAQKSHESSKYRIKGIYSSIGKKEFKKERKERKHLRKLRRKPIFKKKPDYFVMQGAGHLFSDQMARTTQSTKQMSGTVVYLKKESS